MKMKTMEKSAIDSMLLELPEEMIQEVKDFIGYLLEKEKRRKAFEERVLKAQNEPSMEFESVDNIMKAIRDFKE